MPWSLEVHHGCAAGRDIGPCRARKKLWSVAVDRFGMANLCQVGAQLTLGDLIYAVEIADTDAFPEAWQ